MSSEASIQVVDSHTEGEPTRVVIGGAPDLGGGTMRERLERLREQHDWLRTTCVLEPRGADAVVGALLCEPDDVTRAQAVSVVVEYLTANPQYGSEAAIDGAFRATRRSTSLSSIAGW